MSTLSILFRDAIGRPVEIAHDLVATVDPATLNRQPVRGANSITWLLWHVGREIDLQIAALAGAEEVWVRDGWAERFALPLPADAMGYGHTDEEAALVQVEDPSLLTGYLDAVVAAATAYVDGLDTASLDEIIDRSWDPPVSRGTRLVSIVDDAAQHAGQASYVAGLLARG
jgi:hypothetical protein